MYDIKREEILNYILEGISNYIGIDAEELHNEMFNNTGCYIIGTYQATEWCSNNVFYIINVIREYENDNFGEVATDLSNPENVVNMYAYIVGEEILSKCWELLRGELTAKKIAEIVEAIRGAEHDY